MCEYCSGDEYLKISGKAFEFHKTAGYIEDYIKYRSWILQGNKDKKAGIMVSTNGADACYFDINYCPICGRKLGD